ncbi:hypothetical protein DFH07DRAFT_728868 [Mycena maculata]|uniref:HMG domain-containing protein n=1 Tax=Mycena maculata TaxID=230809 RepID=A0AAD7KAX6_9AGAR|nr:hypothetical protein DFH07DRAFT_728868 [Mycena maculata]
MGSDPGWNSQTSRITSDINNGSDLTSTIEDRGYPEYCESIQEEGGAFYQIGAELFVMNGWEPHGKTSKSSWYHLQRSTIGRELVTVCRCPLARPNEQCVHEQFLTEYGDELFPLNIEFSSEQRDAILFSRQELEEAVYINHFSVPSPNSRSLNGRVIVEYTGDDTGSGQWLCSKDSNNPGCAHINKCQDMLQKLVQIDPSATDEGVGDGSSIDYSVPRSRRSAAEENKSVSHLPIAPPPWAALDSDPLLYHRSPALEDTIPDILNLTQTSTCCCSEPRPSFDPAQVITQQTCTVYGLFRSWEMTIEIQTCTNSMCHHRSIGPDCRELGIFNYNNRKLFTHDLLDEYTSAYTSSETPFSAWVSVLSRRYEIHSGGETQFATAQMFRAVWFAYVKLQYLEGDMMCPRCGPSPESTIWDGVTLAFNRKHLLPTLEPPTVSQSGSIDRSSTKYVTGQQLLAERRVRGLVRQEDSSEGEDEEDDDADDDHRPASGRNRTRAERAEARARAEILQRLDAIPLAVQALKTLDLALGDLFDAQFGEGTVTRGDPAPDVYRRFFIQAFSAEESVLQMLTAPAMDALEAFVVDPTRINASSLVEIPTIHKMLSYEKRLGPFTNTTVAVCRWILNRGRTVLNSLMKGPAPPKISEARGSIEKPWIETGCCYGLPKIRERPRYPKLKHDIKNEVGGKRGAKCSKFYSQYGERRLTGGIMCVWCTHSICYGFHCIPRGEGRNDVFSALITRWETVPKRVIYDFACALGPYCMTREPEFFSNTQFLTDDFHSVGHTKCSPAAFLKSHCNVDPRLSHINSSAGECGNSGIACIRKSVSYMSQAQAILYSKVFLSIWNRLRIRSLH